MIQVYDGDGIDRGAAKAKTPDRLTKLVTIGTDTLSMEINVIKQGFTGDGVEVELRTKGLIGFSNVVSFLRENQKKVLDQKSSDYKFEMVINEVTFMGCFVVLEQFENDINGENSVVYKVMADKMVSQ